MSSVLEVAHIAKSFGGVAAVCDVSFQVGAGELLAMIGPNGAGKTTCFNMLSGQVAPDRGTVKVTGRNIAGLAPRAVWRLGVGRTFQITATFRSMTARENVQMALLAHHGRLARWWRPVAPLYHGEADGLLAQVGMRAQAEQAAAVLAYGDLKRLELAVALAHAPRLLLMDEPTAGMAPKERQELMALVAAIARERNTAVLFTEHDMDVVFGYADRVIVLDRGRLLLSGIPSEVRANPEIRQIYFGVGPRT